MTSRAWKIDLQLNGKGKEGSRQLAIRLFPTAAELLKCALYKLCILLTLLALQLLNLLCCVSIHAYIAGLDEFFELHSSRGTFILSTALNVARADERRTMGGLRPC